jgi:2-C-methyl-D-erythritol 4-phosphate cytidylyltransferase
MAGKEKPARGHGFVVGSAGASPSLAAVIVAAGASRRMGFDKMLTPVGGEPLVRHAVRAFEQCATVGEIVIVCAKERELELRAVLADAQKVTAFAHGGETRQESVLNGLAAVRAEYVAVHDGARPLVTPDLIVRCFDAAREHGASVAAEPLTDTLQRADESGCCAGIVDREGLWRMQTPQVFRTADIVKALESAMADGLSVTDETSAFERVAGRVFLVENGEWNFKVTFPRDVAVAEFILQSRGASSLT